MLFRLIKPNYTHIRNSAKYITRIALKLILGWRELKNKNQSLGEWLRGKYLLHKQEDQTPSTYTKDRPGVWLCNLRTVETMQANPWRFLDSHSSRICGLQGQWETLSWKLEVKRDWQSFPNTTPLASTHTETGKPNPHTCECPFSHRKHEAESVGQCPANH